MDTIDKIKENKDYIEYNVSVITDGIALFLWLEVPYSDGWFSENGVTMTVPRKNVTFYSRKPISKNDFKKLVSVKTVFV